MGCICPRLSTWWPEIDTGYSPLSLSYFRNKVSSLNLELAALARPASAGILLSLCSLQCWGHRGTLKHHTDRCFDLFSSWILFFLSFFQVADFPVKAIAFPSVTLRLSSFQEKVGGSDRRDSQVTSFATSSARLSLSVLESERRE